MRARCSLGQRGWLDQEDLAELSEAGVDRQKINEIVAFVGPKTISKHVNHFAGMEVDPHFR